MLSLFSQSKLYVTLLLVLPFLSIVAWVNVLLGNAAYSNYLLTLLLPALVLSHIVSIIATDSLDTSYRLTPERVFFTIGFLILFVLFYSYVMTLFGFDSFFLTVYVKPNTVIAPEEAASQFYSVQLMVMMMALTLIYSLAIKVFKARRRRVLDF